MPHFVGELICQLIHVKGKMELANHHVAADKVTAVPGNSKLVGEIPMRNSSYRISKNLCVRLVLIKKRAVVISQWRNLMDTTLAKR